jgi:hypothetical protein
MNALKKIIAEAKRLKKKHPNTKWTSLTKMASAKYRAGKLGSTAAVGKRKRTVKRKAARKVVHKHSGQVVRVKHVLAGTVSHHVSKAKMLLKEQIGWAEAAKFTAKTKRSKSEIGKKIAKLKQQYNKLG